MARTGCAPRCLDAKDTARADGCLLLEMLACLLHAPLLTCRTELIAARLASAVRDMLCALQCYKARVATVRG